MKHGMMTLHGVLTITQLKQFDLNKVKQSENIKGVLPELARELIDFLEDSREKVWIEYDLIFYIRVHSLD